jgi:hypothetical protein
MCSWITFQQKIQLFRSNSLVGVTESISIVKKNVPGKVKQSTIVAFPELQFLSVHSFEEFISFVKNVAETSGKKNILRKNRNFILISTKLLLYFFVKEPTNKTMILY